MDKNGYSYVGDDNPINNQYLKLLSNNKKSSQDSGSDVQDIKHSYPGTLGGKPADSMKSHLMTFTQLLEAMDAISDSIESHNEDPMNDQIDDSDSSDNVNNEPAPTTDSTDSSSNNDLLDQLNKIFTPVLVMQGFENDVSDKIQSAMSEAAVFTEKNVIQFDDQTRMAQLISVCALLIARKKNSEKYQMYEKAHNIRNQMKLDIQKEEYEAAKALAQQYLVKVSTTNNNSVARDAANKLLPETQH